LKLESPEALVMLLREPLRLFGGGGGGGGGGPEEEEGAGAVNANFFSVGLCMPA
jgi:hypothetical protein